jgi:hypothetical protein
VLEYTAHNTGFNVFVYLDGATQEAVYAYGDDGSWTTAAITGAASATGYNTAAIEAVAMKMCPNNEYVHVAWVADDKIFYARLDDPDDPSTQAKWHDFATDNMGNANTKFQRVDNTAFDKRSVSITVDDSTKGAVRGNDIAHITWDVSDTVWKVHYNIGDQGPGAAEFNNTREIQLSTDGGYPSIINIKNDGRHPQVFWLNAAGVVMGFKCEGNYPLPVANWTGQEENNGAGSPDTILSPVAPLGTGYDQFSVTYTWDQHERVFIGAMDAGFEVACRYFEGNLRAQNPTWFPQRVVSGWSVGTTPQNISVTNICGAFNVFGNDEMRFFVQDSNDVMWHAWDTKNANGDYTFDAGSTWIRLGTTVPDAGRLFTSEWRSLEHNDLAQLYRRTHCMWLANGTDNLWFSRVRENTPPDGDRVSPPNDAKLRHDTAGTITLDWSTTDLELDTQDDFKIQVDEDDEFGSPEVDPGWAGAGTSTTQYTIPGTPLAFDTLYEWRLKLRDDEKGDEYDFYSETPEWLEGPWTFHTTPNLSVELWGYSIETNEDIKIHTFLLCDLDAGETLIDAEFKNATPDDYAQYQKSTDNGQTWTSWTQMTIDESATSTENGGEGVTGPITTGRSPGSLYTLIWNADADLGTDFEGLVKMRVRAQYDGDPYSGGFSDWSEHPDEIFVDFAPPSVSTNWPKGDDIADTFPTLYATISDVSGFESQFQLDMDSGFGSVDAGHDSGYVDSAVSFTPTTELTIGTWYWRVRARDKSDNQNESSWVDDGVFYVKAGGYLPTVLDDGTNTVTLLVIEDVRVSLVNVLVEYDNIRNDFDETAVLQNIPEYRGHIPVEISYTALFYGGDETQTDIKRIHTWMRDETKITVKDEDDYPLTVGDSTANYIPNKFKVTELVPSYRPGYVNSFVYEITVREVPA